MVERGNVSKKSGLMSFDKIVRNICEEGKGRSRKGGEGFMLSPLCCPCLLLVTFSAPAPGSTNEFSKWQVEKTGFPKTTHDKR